MGSRSATPMKVQPLMVNTNTIQYKRKNCKHNEKLPQTFLQADDNGNSQIGEDNAVSLEPEGPKE